MVGQFAAGRSSVFNAVARLFPVTVVSGVPSLLRPVAASLLMAVLMAVLGVAQGAAQAPAATPAAPPSAPASAVPTPAPAAEAPAAPAGATGAAAVTSVVTVTSYGKVLVDGAKLRCWASAVAAPPVFDDVLAKDQVVGVGRSESGFRAIVLPFGPIGYVNKKFAAMDEAGRVHSKGVKVAFRYRPKTTEAPVAQLADGTELFVIGDHEDWWRVRVDSVEAWLPEVEVQALATPDATVVAAFAELKAKQAAEVQVRLDQIAVQKQQEEQNKADEATVLLVQEAFTAELKKPVAEQDFAPLDGALEKLDQSLAKESTAKGSIAALRQRIQAQKWIVEATVVRDSKPVPSSVPTTAPQPKDELSRFQSIGWLRYESRLVGVGSYYLEKGGIRQHLVSCSSGRYDLGLFVGREVGVMGPRRRPATESLSVLDVERLEVLGNLAN